MEKYNSKQVQILRPVSDVYGVLSDFTNFTPVLKDKVEGWEATPDTCSFRAKGISAGLRIIDREENSLVKIAGSDGAPFDFTFWIQLKEVGHADTRMRMVLHAELNMMMKMMLGGKLQSMLDKLAETIGENFNKAG